MACSAWCNDVEIKNKWSKEWRWPNGKDINKNIKIKGKGARMKQNKYNKKMKRLKKAYGYGDGVTPLGVWETPR